MNSLHLPDRCPHIAPSDVELGSTTRRAAAPALSPPNTPALSPQRTYHNFTIQRQLDEKVLNTNALRNFAVVRLKHFLTSKLTRKRPLRDLWCNLGSEFCG